MQIAIDTSPLESGHKGRGVGTYTKQLIAALKKVSPTTNFDTNTNPQQSTADLVHYPYFDLFFQTLPLFKPKPSIVTIHDLIPLNFADQFPIGFKGTFAHLTQQLSLLLNVPAIITDSQASKTDIISHYGFNPQHIHVTHLAASSEFKPLSKDKIEQFKKKHKLTKPILGYVGDINYNKNLPRLIEAASSVSYFQLVIVTRADLNQSIPEVDAINQALAKIKTKHQVTFLSLPTSEDLVLFYNACEWYIQPSLAEGFGLPVLEAMQSGTPVLSANTSSLPEIAGQAAIYFDPYNTTHLSTKINQASQLTTTQRQNFINKSLNQVKKFSWEKTARQTLAIYENIHHPTKTI